MPGPQPSMQKVLVLPFLDRPSAFQQPFVLDSLPHDFSQAAVARRAGVEVIGRDILGVLDYLIADSEEVYHSNPPSALGSSHGDGLVPLLNTASDHRFLLAIEA